MFFRLSAGAMQGRFDCWTADFLCSMVTYAREFVKQEKVIVMKANVANNYKRNFKKKEKMTTVVKRRAKQTP